MKIKASKNQQIFCLIIIALFLLVNLLRIHQQLHRYVDSDIEHSLKRIDNYIVESRIAICPIAKNMPKKEFITSDEFKQIFKNYTYISRQISYLERRCRIVKDKFPNRYKFFKDCDQLIGFSKESDKVYELRESIYKNVDHNNSIPLGPTDMKNFETLYDLYKKLSIKLQEIDY